MDPTAVVAVGIVALAVVITGAVWGHRRGGLRLEVRIWWGDKPADKQDPPEVQ